MTTRTMILAAAAVAALGLPALASAQTWSGYGGGNGGGYGGGYGGSYGYGDDGHGYGDNGYGHGGYGYGQGDYGRGDGHWRHRRFPGYPQFRGEERHIRGEIRQAIDDQLIDDGQGAELNGQLRGIQAREAREFSYHGWHLPGDDQASIQAQLDQLDREVDQLRDD